MELSREHILEEISRIKYLFEMKRVYRFNQPSDTDTRAESNAEHLYGMMILAHYFLSLENLDDQLDMQRVYQLILVHDIDEIETGDLMTWDKTQQDRDQAKGLHQKMLDQFPEHWNVPAQELLSEYEQQQTTESRYVKAIDKIEPVIELFDDKGKRIMIEQHGTMDKIENSKFQYTQHFSVIHHYLQTLLTEMDCQGYFYENS